MEQIQVDADDAAQQMPESMNLKGLIDDCKETILEKLDLVDLLNIADSSKQLNPIACQVFKAKYSNRRVTIDNESGNRNCIRNPLVTLKLLRNFGHLIKDLKINFALFNVDLCEKVEQYLVKYCCKSLNFVSIRCHPYKELFQNIDEPFSNVYSIEMQCCCFLRCKMSYNEFFPRLRFLQLDSNRYESRSFINTNIPFLRSLAILKDFEEDEIVASLELNPQIEKLLLVTNYSEKLIRRLNTCLPKLQCLCLRDLPRPFRYEYFDPVHFDHLIDFSMSSGPDVLEKLPFTFSRLEHLSIAAQFDLDQKWLSLLGGIEHLKSIGLFDVKGDINKVFELTNIQWGIEKVNISLNDKVTADCIIAFFKHNRSLKKITVTSYQTDFSGFLKKIQSSTRSRIQEFPAAQQFTSEFLAIDPRIQLAHIN